MTPPEPAVRSDARPAGNGPGRKSLGGDTVSLRASSDIAGLTRDESRRFAEWLAASYSADPLEAAKWSDLELARCAQLNREIGYQAVRDDLEQAGRAAAAAATRSVWRTPTHAELQRRRYGIVGPLDHWVPDSSASAS